jgi:CHASE2 domain-containing sensor protein
MTRKWLRRIARGLGAFWGCFWIFSLIATGIGEVSGGEYQWDWEGIALAGLIAVEAIGIVIAWEREKIGGAVIAVTSIILCVFAYFSAGHNHWFAVLVSGVPFLISGVLFLLVSRQKSKGSP